jgi:hypothetical protein
MDSTVKVISAVLTVIMTAIFVQPTTMARVKYSMRPLAIFMGMRCQHLGNRKATGTGKNNRQTDVYFFHNRMNYLYGHAFRNFYLDIISNKTYFYIIVTKCGTP